VVKLVGITFVILIFRITLLLQDTVRFAGYDIHDKPRKENDLTGGNGGNRE